MTLVNAVHITASVFFNDDAGLWAGCTTALASTPAEYRFRGGVQDGQGRRPASEAAAETGCTLQVVGRDAQRWRL